MGYPPREILGIILQVKLEKNSNNRTRKHLMMKTALHPRDNVNGQYVTIKETGILLYYH